MSIVNDILYTIASCVSCFQSPILRINRHGFRMLKLLGEGGFSHVYLVQAENGEEYALKRVRCPFGAESIRNAMREVDSYKLFDSPNVIKLLESSVVQERDGTKTVYMVLPYYKHGNLQDRINENLINNKHYEERELLMLFAELCKSVRVFHKHRMSGPRGTLEGEDDGDEIALLEDQDADDTALNELIPYAHRDIKPANVMLDDHNRPVLMDLGSCSRARLTLQTRQQALELQDLAAEHCTMPYRAPELFDVKTGSSVDERVDVWSLGCTLFALMYNASPFELATAESGASLSMAILKGSYKFPANPEYSEELKALVDSCLVVDPAQRPYVDDVLDKVEAVLAAP